MYVVIVEHKILAALTDLLVEVRRIFPNDQFYIDGSEDKGYKLKVDGNGDEKAPRKLAEPFLKKWKPSPEQLIEEQLAAKKAEQIAQMQKDDAEYFAKQESVAQENKPRRGRPPKKVYETLDTAFVVK